MLGRKGEQAGVVCVVLETVESPGCLAFFEHGLEQRLAPDREHSFDARGLRVVRIAERVRAVGLDIPLHVAESLVVDGIDEGELAGAVVIGAEADNDVLRVGETKIEFSGHSGLFGFEFQRDLLCSFAASLRAF